jgi:tetratricopeptide (TPR) repeat protein
LTGAMETPETAGAMRPGPARTSPAAAERPTAPPAATGVAVAAASQKTPKTAGAMTPGPARTSLAAAERPTAAPAGTVVAVAATSTSALDLITIVTARAFYNAAAYENALATLEKLTENASPEIERAANQYRAGCLYALGRTAEAEATAEMMIRKDPLVRLDEIEMSPRVLEMFASLRRRLLPK